MNDVTVIGGGPAGLACAIAARLQGLEVTLIDGRRPPLDKACGEGIMPDGVSLLARLGVLLPEEGTYPFRGIRYVGSGADAVGRFKGRPGLGVRRTVLMDALLRRARETGVRLHWGQSVRRVTSRGVDVGGRLVASRWIVGADGQTSRIRKSLGLDLPPRHQRFGIRRHYAMAPWSDMVEVFWSAGCEAYVTPVARDLICVALLTADKDLKLDDGLARFPELRRRLAGARRVTGDLGSATRFGAARDVISGATALVGDASGSVDAITGAGVSLALHQAVALARAQRLGDLRAYREDHRRLMRLPRAMTSLMLAINDRAWLRGPALHALDRIPGLFSLLLALHTRGLPMSYRDSAAASPPWAAQGSASRAT